MSEHPLLTEIRGLLANLTSPFVLVADIKVHAGQGNDFANAVARSRTVPRSRQEPGCMTYDLCRHGENTFCL